MRVTRRRKLRRIRTRQILKVCVLAIIATTFCRRTSTVATCGRDVEETTDDSWIRPRARIFLERWASHGHRVLNLVSYTCVCLSPVPLVNSLTSTLLSCPEIFYDSAWRKLFAVPLVCISHGCLSRFGRSHFVYADFVVQSYTRVVALDIVPKKLRENGKVAVLLEPRQHPFEGLPSSAFGTPGTLAFRHRQIFVRELKNYDYFLVQEDDVSYTADSIMHYIKSHEIMAKFQPALHPAFFDTEMYDANVHVSYRMREGYIFQVQNRLYFSSINEPGGRGYIIPRAELFSLIDEDGLSNFLDVEQVSGEFNPQVSSFATTGRKLRLVFPLENWAKGAISHLSNKYIKYEVDANMQSMFSTIRSTELAAAFSSCEKANMNVHVNLSIIGNCNMCIENGQAAYMKTSLAAQPFTARKITFSFTCEDKELIKYPGFEQEQTYSSERVTKG